MGNENGEEEQISYEICQGVFAANEADIAKLKAAAAEAASARAALKAGLTCSVEDNCVGGDVDVETACILGDDGDYTCEIKESENPEGVTTADGSNTACTIVEGPDADGDYYSPQPCDLFAARKEAEAASD